jgi:DNA polymerase-3 subunit beta
MYAHSLQNPGQAMNIVVRREALLAGCRLAERAVAERGIEPVLHHALLETREGGCMLRATNREMELSTAVEAEVHVPGQTLLPVSVVLGIVREVRGSAGAPETGAETLTLTAAPGRLAIRGPEAVFELEVPDAEAFPPPSTADLFDRKEEPLGGCLLPPERLRQAILRTIYAAGGHSARYNLQAVLLEPEGTSERTKRILRLVATDNRRLAVAEVPVLAGAEQLPPQPRLLPVRTADLLARLCASVPPPVEMQAGDSGAFFRVGRSLLVSRYLEGAYPPWKEVIPSALPHTLCVSAGTLLSCVRRAAVLRRQEQDRLILRLSLGQLTLELWQPGCGSVRSWKQVVPCGGGPVEVALKPAFLLDLLRNFEPQTSLLVGLIDADSPAVFQAADGYTHVLMPLRLR